ncbi:MAG: glycosyltransferase family 39 protein [Flavobacteriales bacterium]|nr:glycosyltransferase family 39 protein [Flavobacteriales bacterium]
MLYLASWSLFGKQKINAALALILVSGLILRVFLASDQYVHQWDERYHAVVAKNMIEDPFVPKLYADPVLDYNYREWSGNHIWLHKPPLPLWTMATSMWLFGVNVWALRLPSILFSTLAILLMYHVGKGMFSRKVGFISALLLSFNGLIIELVSGKVATDHVDVFFFFFILLTVYLIVKLVQRGNGVYNLLIGITLGCALLSKWLPALVVLPVYLLFLIHSQRFSTKQIIAGLGTVVGIAILVAGPWQLYIHQNWPLEVAYESQYNLRHLTESLGKHEYSTMYHFHNLRIIYGELVYIPCLWLIYKTFARRRINLNYLALLIWFLVPFLFFTFAATKMQAYTLMAAPAIFLIVALFWVYLSRMRFRFKYQLIPKLLLIALIVLPGRYGWERLKPLEAKDRSPIWLEELYALEIDAMKPTVLFNCDRPMEAMFHLDCTAYSENPDAHFKNELERKGYEVVTLN